MRTRVAWAVAGLTALLGTVVPATAGAATPTGTGDPDICAALPDAIPVTALKAGVSSHLCGGLVGAKVVSPSGAGAAVPSEGTNAAEVLRTNGAEIITVSNSNGIVTATDDRSNTVAPAGPEPTASASSAPLACSQGAYNYVHNMDHWGGVLAWYYNSSTQSRSGLGGSGPLDAIRQGNTNMTTNQNDCGSTVSFAARGAYSGDTARYANIDRTGSCTALFPDRTNAVSWGPFDSGQPALAVTCWHYYNGVMTEADSYYGSNRSITVGLPSGCSGSYDLQSIATHEWGHAFGMAHETSGEWETMYPSVNSCSTYLRTLGKGDTDGMYRLYGPG